jgi:DNA polymerase-1
MYALIERENDANESIQTISNYNDVIGLDIETTGLNCFTDDVLLVQVCLDSKTLIFDIRKLGIGILTKLVSALSAKKCILHNAKFDIKFLYNKTGIWLRNLHCTLVSESILNAGKLNVGLGLVDLVMKYCDVKLEKESRSQFINLSKDFPITESMLVYAVKDVIYLKVIYQIQLEQAKKAAELQIIDLEMELIPVVAQMEFTGIKLDTGAWTQLELANRRRMLALISDYKEFLLEKVIKKLNKKSNEVEYTALSVAELLHIPVKTKKETIFLKLITDLGAVKTWLITNFNVNSSHQIKAAFELLNIKVRDTNEKTISPLKDKHEEIKRLLEIREVAKQVSTYGLKFLDLVNSVTGRIHTEYFTGGTVTGRFSSSSPNMQNIPVSGGFRECFIPEEGKVLISCDYSQQEYRLAGAVSRDRAIINAYKSGSDMHTATAAIQFSKSLLEVTKEERFIGKTMNFAILYGSSEWGLHKNLKVPVEKAKAMIEKFFSGYPSLSKFKELAEERIMALGYSCTPMGRRRYNLQKPIFTDSKAYASWEARVKREGFNLIIQGGGADIIKMAMLNISRKNPFGKKLRLLLQIHDELLAEVDADIQNEALEFLKTEMAAAEQPFLGEIPAVVDGSIKDRWTK